MASLSVIEDLDVVENRVREILLTPTENRADNTPGESGPIFGWR